MSNSLGFGVLWSESAFVRNIIPQFYMLNISPLIFSKRHAADFEKQTSTFTLEKGFDFLCCYHEPLGDFARIVRYFRDRCEVMDLEGRGFQLVDFRLIHERQSASVQLRKLRELRSALKDQRQKLEHRIFARSALSSLK